MLNVGVNESCQCLEGHSRVRGRRGEDKDEDAAPVLRYRGNEHAVSSGMHLLDGVLAAAETIHAVLVDHREARHGCGSVGRAKHQRNHHVMIQLTGILKVREKFSVASQLSTSMRRQFFNVPTAPTGSRDLGSRLTRRKIGHEKSTRWRSLNQSERRVLAGTHQRWRSCEVRERRWVRCTRA